ncbi:MAG: phosphatidylglycerophosphatase A [Candidatus Omnitrophota bacterium]
MKRFSKAITTVFGIGYTPIASGTVGSFAALILYYFVKENIFIQVSIIVIGIFLGFLTIPQVEKETGRKDPSIIVLDEVIGMFIALFLLPGTFGYMIAGFFLFRLFDILKPFPGRRLEKIPGTIGVIGDDVIAGIYANLILHLFHYLFK